MERTLKASEGLIKIGYNRILEKVKDIRQKFSTALANVKKKGSDKIVLEYFDLVKIIHGGVSAEVKIPSWNILCNRKHLFILCNNLSGHRNIKTQGITTLISLLYWAC